MLKNDIINFFTKRKINAQSTNFLEMTELSSASSREIYLTTITPQIAETIDKTIRMWNAVDDTNTVEWAQRKPVKIYINSTGGDFDAMLTIMDSIRLSKTPVYTINIGVTHKEALFVFIAGYQRYSYPKASFLYERDLKHIDENDPYFNFYEKQLGFIKDVILEKTKITDNEYNKHLKNVWWLTAEDAQKVRICNEVLNAYQSI